jgi:catechol 2,3-dioxygenase
VAATPQGWVPTAQTERRGNSVYLRAWGDYERHTLKLTAHSTSGVGHLGLRVRDDATLQRFVADFAERDIAGRWVEDRGHGPAYRVATPDGHAVELYWETERFTATPEIATAFKNQPQRYVPRGIAPRRLDHVNLLARDVAASRRFFQERLGLRLTEQIVLDDGLEAGAWLSATNKSYDLAITRDHTGASGRFHHLTFMMDSREDVLRAADVLRDADVAIETGPHKHNIGQTFFLYCFEPGGNRFEIGAGGYLIFDPDWKPIVWTQAERAKGQAWGLQTVSSFHTRGTPPVESAD